MSNNSAPRGASANGSTRLPLTELERLIAAIEVSVVTFSKCIVSPGWRLRIVGSELPALHYVLSGEGSLVLSGARPIQLVPDTLVVMPPGHTCVLEASGADDWQGEPRTVDARLRADALPDTKIRSVAGNGEPRLVVLCGHIQAALGGSVPLFPPLSPPVVEQFHHDDRLNETVQLVLAEKIAQKIGMSSMTEALLKQVLVILLRQSLASNGSWVQRLAALSDPRIGRAFMAMLSDPAAGHTVLKLAQIAGLSRSTFMARFAQTFDRSPMVVLREMRLARAATHLALVGVSVDQAARIAGYTSRSSFSRAFRKLYGKDPSDS